LKLHSLQAMGSGGADGGASARYRLSIVEVTGIISKMAREVDVDNGGFGAENAFACSEGSHDPAA
jgi:hypothetical protein